MEWYWWLIIYVVGMIPAARFIARKIKPDGDADYFASSIILLVWPAFFTILVLLAFPALLVRIFIHKRSPHE